MGTAANLCVKMGDRHVVIHASHDSTPENVLSSVCATLAACGVENFKQHFSQCTIFSEDDDHPKLSRSSMRRLAADNYVTACQANNQDAFAVDHFLHAQYGRPGFSTAGVIELFAPTLISEDGFVGGDPTHADHILDLDTLTISSLGYESHEDYSEGKPPEEMVSVDLTRLEGLNPEHVAFAFSRDFSFEWGSNSMSKMQAQGKVALDLVFTTIANPEQIQARIEKEEADSQRWLEEHEARTRMEISDFSRDPTTTHVFSFHPDDAALMAALSTMMMRNPLLGQPGVVQFTPQPDEEGRHIVVNSTDEAVNQMMDGLSDNMRGWCNYASVGKDGSSSRKNAHAQMVSTGWIGIGGRDEEPDVVPKNLQNAMPRAELLEKLPAFIQAQTDTQVAYGQRIVALISLDWEVLALLPHLPVEEDDKKWVSEAIVAYAKGFEELQGPGSLRQAFEAFSQVDQDEVLNLVGPAYGNLFKPSRRMKM